LKLLEKGVSGYLSQLSVHNYEVTRLLLAKLMFNAW